MIDALRIETPELFWLTSEIKQAKLIEEIEAYQRDYLRRRAAADRAAKKALADRASERAAKKRAEEERKKIEFARFQEKEKARKLAKRAHDQEEAARERFSGYRRPGYRKWWSDALRAIKNPHDNRALDRGYSLVEVLQPMFNVMRKHVSDGRALYVRDHDRVYLVEDEKALDDLWYAVCEREMPAMVPIKRRIAPELHDVSDRVHWPRAETWPHVYAFAV